LGKFPVACFSGNFKFKVDCLGKGYAQNFFVQARVSIKESAMLILTRRVGETLVIGDKIRLTVLGTRGNQVRIGVDAPKDVAVHREEIYERIQAEKDYSRSMSEPQSD
tara:strand:+ start:219 stop:542 length:324 start_codon:yes stop_codon:yes gene_type:complete